MFASFAASMAGLVHKWKEFLGQSQTMTSCPITITNQNLIMLKRQADDIQPRKKIANQNLIMLKRQADDIQPRKRIER